jgi:isoleucyl-tRNA synthetase
MFAPLPDKPDHVALEEEVLAWWEAAGIFEKLRGQNRGGPRFSFIDGPVTANKTLAVHTAWGRTLKDVFQRHKALRGFDQRYQNGFDCQGLWIEVGVERELGLNSKREIEEYGLEKFAEKCREVVVWSSRELTKGCIRLGQWMDWGNDYFTFSDTNIEYIWKFLEHVHERGWLYLGHRSTEWCPRCGTSLSQHELTQGGVFQEKTDPSLYVRFPLIERAGESLVVWTTTPWTLPANVAAAVKPEAEYGLRDSGEWVLAARYPDDRFVRHVRGEELVGLRYQAPFDDLPPAADIEHRVIPWNEVSLDEGTGIVHIAPGCGPEDFDLSRLHDLPVLTPVDEAGRFYDDYGWLHGLSTTEATDQIVGRLAETGFLLEAGTYEHRYPHCWRCDTPLIWRLSDDWFIAVDDVRQQLIDVNDGIAWTPAYMGKRMEDWLRNMGDWNISRRRYYGLPLPIYACACGRVNVVGSKAELLERAVGDGGSADLPELRRPWIDRIAIRCDACGNAVSRIPDVGDVWLDAGIVPFSTLGWENAEWIEEGYATGAARGLTHADLPDHAYWEEWFPADWVTEMREQIRLWFYSQLFMSVVLTGRAPFRQVLGYEKMLDERGREMHGSWGNMIEAQDAFEQMGADVIRWQCCAWPNDRDLRFGFARADKVKRELLTLWHCVKFVVDYGNVVSWRPAWSSLEPVTHLRPLDQWLVERTHDFVREGTAGYDAFLTRDVIRAYERFVDDVSNWYIRRSRRRFWDGDATALAVLWFALVQALRLVSPIMPFLTEHLWRNLVPPDEGAPESVFLAGWPESRDPDRSLLEEIAAVRRVVDLGRRARSASGLKLRQPLRLMVVQGAPATQSHVDELREELRVKVVEFGNVEVTDSRVKPNLPLLGPKLGKELGPVRQALAAGEWEQLEDGGVRVNGYELGPDEVLVERSPREGWALAEAGGVTVALSTDLDDELLLEGRVLNLIHLVNTKRRDAGLALTDRITLALPESDAELLRHADWIKDDVLATEIRTDSVAEPQIERA